MLRYLTAGESHGPALIAIVEGMPSGLPLRPPISTGSYYGARAATAAAPDEDESDTVSFLSGCAMG